MSGAPVAYVVFNRPRQTRLSFEALRAQRPTQLFIIADGPRSTHPEDAVRCREVRDIVAAVGWECDVRRLYADRNLGCEARVSSGLDWVFSHVERAVVLEDDCIPHPDFFTFTEALLDRYETDERIWHITGGQYSEPQRARNCSYYFSKYPHIWGWATWRRAWHHYDRQLSFWPEWKRSQAWRDLMPDSLERRYWTRVFDKVYRGEVDSWAYRWIACVWYHRGLTAAPRVNLVENTGIGADATHTSTSADHSGPLVRPIGSLVHPNQVWHDAEADKSEFYHSSWGAELQRQRTPAGLARAAVRHFLRSVRTRRRG